MDFAAERKHVQHQQNGGSVGVYHGRVFGAGKLAQQVSNTIVALTASTGRQVKLDSGGVGQGISGGFAGQRGTAKIGMQYRAREINHRSLG